MTHPDGVYVAVPDGSNRFFAPGGGYEFAHGGATLQELIIPVLFSYRKNIRGFPEPVAAAHGTSPPCPAAVITQGAAAKSAACLPAFSYKPASFDAVLKADRNKSGSRRKNNSRQQIGYPYLFAPDKIKSDTEDKH